MATIYKPKRRWPIPEGAKIVTCKGRRFAVWNHPKNGRRQKAPLSDDGEAVLLEASGYVIQYFDADGRRRKESTRCPDLDAVKRMAADLETRVAKRRAGYISAAEERAAEQGRRSLEAHLADFRQDLLAKGNSPEHANQVADRAGRVVAGCGFQRIADVTATKVEQHLAERRRTEPRFSPQTSNHYLQAVKQFTRWLKRDRRATDNPLAHLARVNVRIDRRHDRRALSGEEMARVVQAAEAGPAVESVAGPDRTMLYILSAWTGHRRKELNSLTLRSLDLDGDPPTVRIAAAYAKGRREDETPLHPGLVARLRTWIAQKCLSDPETPLFQLRTPGGHWRKTAKMMRIDLAAARAKWIAEAATDRERGGREASDVLTYQDADGLFADFHSNRHSFITSLGIAGVDLTTAQKLARHSDPKLTSNTYTHLGVSNMVAAIEALPAPPLPQASGGQPQLEVLAATGTDDAQPSLQSGAPPRRAREAKVGAVGGQNAADGDEHWRAPHHSSARQRNV